MSKPGADGITRIVNAGRYSLQGLQAAARHEAAFRQELMLFVVLVPLALWAGETAVDYVLLIGSLFIVLIAELFNSAIEAVVDRVGNAHHELAGRAKDMGSAAVLLSLILVAVTWGIILLYQP